jgi:type I restriction enzyme, S subunit
VNATNGLAKSLPRDWTRKKLKYIASLKSGDAIDAEEITEKGDYPVYGGNGLRGYASRFSHHGDYVLIGRQGALCGNINYASGRFWASEHAVVVDTHGQVEVKWLGELLRSMNLNQYSQSAAQPGLAVDLIANLHLLVPPPEQQRAIAAYLDRETAQIDALIAAKERLLALLAEKRRALITHAVTRGLDPHALLRESGLPWLGQISAHWEIKRLRHISSDITVGVVVNPSSYVTSYGVPFLFGGDVTEQGIDTTKARRIPPEVSRGELAKTCLRTGDVVTVRVGYPGVTAVVPPELDGANCASMMLIRGSSSFDSYWLGFAMNSRIGRSQVEVVQYGAAQEQFNISHALDFRFPVPPIEEQRAIVAHIVAETTKLDSLAAATERTVALLKERRAALIAAAVTGQVDVPIG